MSVSLDAFAGQMQDQWGLLLASLFEQFITNTETAERAWHTQFGERQWIFTDTTAFCRVASSIEATLDTVYQSDVPGALLHGGEGAGTRRARRRGAPAAGRSAHPIRLAWRARGGGARRRPEPGEVVSRNRIFVGDARCRGGQAETRIPAEEATY